MRHHDATRESHGVSRTVRGEKRMPDRELLLERTTLWTPDRWQLVLTRMRHPGRPPGVPVLMVPGYGMNAFAFRFHPAGTSMMGALVEAGLDPWALDLRGTRSSTPPRRRAKVRLADQAFQDLPTAIDHIVRTTRSERIHAIGCSLGGALLYAHVGAMDHRIDRLVTMGSPLAWQDRTWLLKLFGRFGPVVGRLPMKGTRTVARFGLPVVGRVAPDLLSIYMNPRITDIRPAKALSRTVEDPRPDVSMQLTKWLREGHLQLDGHHVTDGLGGFHRPLLVVTAREDGICPPSAAKVALEATGGPAELLEVGHPRHAVSHVDLFFGEHVHDAVYDPIQRFLLGQPSLSVAKAG